MLSAWPVFRPFLVESIVVESEGVRSFLLRPADGGELPEYAAGQHIVVRIPSAGQPQPIRMYSLCGPANKNHYRIGVKAEVNGVGSNFLHGRLRPGDGLEVTAPRGVFTLAADERPLVLIGAGIGITPLLAMLYAVAAANPSREVWWIYTTRDKAHYPFVGEVENVFRALVNGHRHIQFTRPGPGDVVVRDYDVGGRLTVERLAALDLPAGGDYYLCGPPGFMMAVAAALESFGIAASSIKQEAFGAGEASVGAGSLPPPHLPAGPAGDGPTVDFAKSGIQFKWHPRFASLLEAAEACDVPVSWSCRVGVCHRCETTLFSGDVNYVTPPLDLPAGGNVLLCCSAPRGDVQLDL
jgi:ferredoxin-NADP reductase